MPAVVSKQRILLKRPATGEAVVSFSGADVKIESRARQVERRPPRGAAHADALHAAREDLEGVAPHVDLDERRGSKPRAQRERIAHEVQRGGKRRAPLVERLGDAKTANRERAVDLAVSLSTLVVGPSLARDKLRPAWEHKNWRARESTLLWFGRLLAQHDAPNGLGFPLKGTLALVVKLLEDREPPVREAAMQLLLGVRRATGAGTVSYTHLTLPTKA